MHPECTPEQIKLAINELCWTYLPSNTTLSDAEQIALKIFSLINSKHES